MLIGEINEIIKKPSEENEECQKTPTRWKTKYYQNANATAIKYTNLKEKEISFTELKISMSIIFKTTCRTNLSAAMDRVSKLCQDNHS